MNMERPGELPDSANHDMILGEMRGQLREVVHGQANLAMKFDALTREVIGLGALASDIAEQKVTLAALAVRVDALETDKSRREGAQGVFHTILRSPTVAWLAAGAVALWVAFKERLDL